MSQKRKVTADEGQKSISSFFPTRDASNQVKRVIKEEKQQDVVDPVAFFSNKPVIAIVGVYPR